jgi:hypothetical protein
VLVLACVLPAYSTDKYDSDGVWGGTRTVALFGSDGRAWFVLVPLACAALAVLAGLLALARPRPRRFLMGLMSGLGISGLAYFFGLLWWTNALKTFGDDPFVSPSLEGALFLGIGGAGLILVSAAPVIAVEIFASIVGAARVVRGSSREARKMDFDRTRSAMLIPVAALGGVGAAVGIASAFVASGAWGRLRGDSLFELSFGAGLHVVVPSAVAATAAAVILFGDRVNERAAGWLAGCGVALLAYFAGVFGSFDWQPPPGAYVGACAGIMLTLAGALGFAARSR